MIARVAVWEPMPDDDRQWVIDAARIFEGDVTVAEVKAASSKKAGGIGWNDVPRPAPKGETIYRVLRRG
ncbi:MAG: hypothetical protein WAK18_01245 [Nocardioidaceae bacterium]